MTITKIQKIKGHRVFRDFSWPAALHPFGRFNVVYGWNGSGKSTLSNIFRAVEKRSPITEGDATIEVDSVSIRGSTFTSSSPLPRVKVFNRDFIDENVFSTKSGAISPIFFLGTESKEKQQEVEGLQKSLNDPGGLNEQERNADAAIRTAERDLDKFCVSQGDRIRELLRSTGANPYNNYDKSRFKKVVTNLLRDGTASIETARRDDAQKDDLKAKKDAAKKATLVATAIPLVDVPEERKKAEALLSRTVASAALAELDADPGLESWVRTGLSLHGIPRASGSSAQSHCKFCKEPLTTERVAALENHFNDHYERLIGDLDVALSALRAAQQGLDLSKQPRKSEINEHLAEEYATQLGILESLSEKGIGFLGSLAKALEEKKSHPMKAIALEPFLAGVEQSSESEAKTAAAAHRGLIERHNSECMQFDEMVANARAELELALVADASGEYEVKSTTVATARTTRDQLATKIAATTQRIAELEKDIVEHRRAADELNEELKRYLGRDELRFRPEGTGYAITRAGEIAKHLSEGEKTAIAFLYFLKSLQDKGFDLESDIVVIDDPVSSLDANALFSAFGYMRERTKDTGQLFILTHNFSFFRQVKNWFYHLNGGPKSQNKDPATLKARFFMLECLPQTGGRNSALVQLDPLLSEYESEYHYLFKKVHEGGTPSAGATLETYYGLPNIARRLLEAFLSFRYPNHSGLRQQLENLKSEPATKARVLRFVHTYSHEGGAAQDHDPTILAETPAVLREVLLLIKEEDPRHHDEMMSLIGVAPAAHATPAA